MFRPGLPNFEPSQRHDSSCSVPPIGEASYQISPYPTTSTHYLPQSTFQQQPHTPSSIPPFKARPPATLAQLQASKRMFRKQWFLCIHLRYPPTTSKPRCARFRIWQSEVRKRRRQLKFIDSMTQQIKNTVRESERLLAHFSVAASHHGISVETADGEVLCRPLKRRHSPSPPPTATLHVAPLRRYSIHDRHLIARALKTRPKYRHRYDHPPGQK